MQKKVVTEFKGRLNIEVRRQEKLDIVEGKKLRREKLLGRYSKDVVWVEWWKIQKRIFKEVRKKQAKVEVSFSGGETLKRG